MPDSPAPSSVPPGDCGPQAPLTRCFWQGLYDEGRTGWDRGAPSPALDRWLGEGMLAPCRILVPGCGRGHEVVALARSGFDVTAIDYAPAAVAALEAALATSVVGATVVAADLFSFEPPEPFGAIYEQTCLCALEPVRRADYERRLWSWLMPGGTLAAAFMQTDAPGGPPFACPPEAMRTLFPAARWVWPDDLVPEPHPMGLVELTGILRKRG